MTVVPRPPAITTGRALIQVPSFNSPTQLRSALSSIEPLWQNPLGRDTSVAQFINSSSPLLFSFHIIFFFLSFSRLPVVVNRRGGASKYSPFVWHVPYQKYSDNRPVWLVPSRRPQCFNDPSRSIHRPPLRLILPRQSQRSIKPFQRPVGIKILNSDDTRRPILFCCSMLGVITTSTIRS